MTKHRKIEAQAPAKSEKPRKLSKAEEEEYTRLMNEAWQEISKSIQAGKIKALWWREPS
ncbi:MAG TPA: hypothetical protein VF627_06850 [Abditibacterium sp.]|jgi:hypothetical protein